MDFSLTEEQELLLESLDELMARECTPQYVRECDEAGRYPDEFAQAMVDAGFGLLGVPEEYDGVPVDTLTLMLVKERLMKNGGPICLFTQPFLVDTVLTFGNKDQIKATMEAVKVGKIAHCSGFTEPEAGSDNSGLKTTFTRRDGKVYINGQKSFITNADKAPYMMCLTRDPLQEDPRKAFTTWWVPLDSPGIKIDPLSKLGWHMSNTCEVYLDNVEVDEDDIFGVEGNALRQTMKNFELERLLMAAGALGSAECAYGDAASYANSRVQFGKTIGSFQLIQQKITNMAIKIENMKNLVYKCAWMHDSGLPIRNESAMAKLYCAQAANEVIDDALQIMGGIGYTNDCRIQRLWRDTRNVRIGGGTDEIMYHVAGRGLLKELKADR